MEKGTKISKEQMKFLARYLYCFKHAYILATGKKLETVEEIIAVIEEGVFTFEDVFMIHVDECLDHEYELSIHWEDNMDKFSYENFFPYDSGKAVHDGAWIKIRTENGFEVHYAKCSMRKRRFEEELQIAQTKLMIAMRKQMPKVKKAEKSADIVALMNDLDAKKKPLETKINDLRLYSLLGIKPYEVIIKRGKGKVEYYNPYQYEIVEDISMFTEACLEPTVGVEIKAAGKVDNEDAIFYLRSRGISEGMARIMASLNQSYFTVNMVQAIEEYNRQWKENVVLIEV